MLNPPTCLNRTAVIVIAFALVAINMAAPPPPDMWANTGAPGEVTCVSCHNQYPENDAGGFLKISTTPHITNGHYIPGQTYLVDETFSRPPLVSYQSSTEIIDSSGTNAGTMLVSDSANTTLLTAQSGRTCLWAGYYNTDTLIHCTFKWVAPQSGEVSFYAAGVARGNLIGGSDGYVSTDSLVHLTPGNANAINAFKKQPAIALYPNPAKNILHIKTAAATPNLSYSIINLNAQLVKTGTTTTGMLDISDLPPGLYTLQCSAHENKMQVISFVKE